MDVFSLDFYSVELVDRFNMQWLEGHMPLFVSNYEPVSWRIYASTELAE